MKAKPGRTLCVRSLSDPATQGPKNSPRCPVPWIRSKVAAAADSLKIIVCIARRAGTTSVPSQPFGGRPTLIQALDKIQVLGVCHGVVVRVGAAVPGNANARDEVVERGGRHGRGVIPPSLPAVNGGLGAPGVGIGSGLRL